MNLAGVAPVSHQLFKNSFSESSVYMTRRPTFLKRGPFVGVIPMRALDNHDSDMPVKREAALGLKPCGSGKLLPDSGSVGFSDSISVPWV